MSNTIISEERHTTFQQKTQYPWLITRRRSLIQQVISCVNKSSSKNISYVKSKDQLFAIQYISMVYMLNIKKQIFMIKSKVKNISWISEDSRE